MAGKGCSPGSSSAAAQHSALASLPWMLTCYSHAIVRSRRLAAAGNMLACLHVVMDLVARAFPPVHLWVNFSTTATIIT